MKEKENKVIIVINMENKRKDPGWNDC